MADIVLYDETGEPVTYENVETLTTDTPTDGETATFTLGEVMDGLEVELNLADGDQTVTAPDRKLLKDLTIKKPDTLRAENIVSPVEIAGVKGIFYDEMKQFIEGNITITNKNASFVTSRCFYSNSNIYLVNLRNCQSVYSQAFQWCSKLMFTVFPKCEMVDYYGFFGCASMMSASFPECKTIGQAGFGGCYKLESAYFPKVSFLAERAFENCYTLEKFDFTPVTSMPGSFAFAKCSALKEVYAPNLMTSSGYWRAYGAFLSCSALSRVYMPKLSYTCTSMFQSCPNLEQVSLPMCISIASSMFRSCSKLVSLYLLNSSVPNMPYSYSYVFLGTPIEGAGSGRIYVKESMYSAYVSARGFTAYSSKIVALTDEEIAALDHWWEEEA